MKVVPDYRMIGADLLTLIRLIHFHNLLTVYVLSLHYSSTKTGFPPTLLYMNLIIFRQDESA